MVPKVLDGTPRELDAPPMPRQARRDAPGTLHHGRVRGSERTQLVRADTDRAAFLARLAPLAEQGAVTLYAWALLPNHAHLLGQPGRQPLVTSLRSLLTGAVGTFHRRHKRGGPLCQNRDRSSVGEAEPSRLCRASADRGRGSGPAPPPGAAPPLSARDPAPGVPGGGGGSIPGSHDLCRQPGGLDPAQPRSEGSDVSCLGTYDRSPKENRPVCLLPGGGSTRCLTQENRPPLLRAVATGKWAPPTSKCIFLVSERRQVLSDYCGKNYESDIRLDRSLEAEHARCQHLINSASASY